MRTFLVCFVLVCAIALVKCRSTYGEEKALLSRALETLKQNHELRGQQLRTNVEDVDFELLALFYGVYAKCVIGSILYDYVGEECPHVMKVNEAFMCLTPPGFMEVLGVISKYKEAMYCVLYDPEGNDPYCQFVFSSDHLEEDAILEEMKQIEQIEKANCKPDCGNKSDDQSTKDSDSDEDETERLLTRLLTKMQKYQNDV